jgi:hypothetical protein
MLITRGFGYKATIVTRGFSKKELILAVVSYLIVLSLKVNYKCDLKAE